MSHGVIISWVYFAAIVCVLASGVWYLGRRRGWGRLSVGLLLAALIVLVASLFLFEAPR